MQSTTTIEGRDIGRVTTTPGMKGHPIQPSAPEPAPAPAGPPEPVTPNEIALHAIRHRITGLDSNTLTLYNGYRGLKSLHAKYAEQVVASIRRQAAQADSQLGHQHTANKIDYNFARGWGDDLTRLAQLEAAMKALECDGALQPALDLLDGMHTERCRLEAAVQADNQARAQAHQHVLYMEKAALAKHQAALASDPDVAAARAKLASFEPAPVAPAALPPVKQPARGKVTLASDELAADLH